MKKNLGLKTEFADSNIITKGASAYSKNYVV